MSNEDELLAILEENSDNDCPFDNPELLKQLEMTPPRSPQKEDQNQMDLDEFNEEELNNSDIANLLENSLGAEENLNVKEIISVDAQGDQKIISKNESKVIDMMQQLSEELREKMSSIHAEISTMKTIMESALKQQSEEISKLNKYLNNSKIHKESLTENSREKEPIYEVYFVKGVSKKRISIEHDNINKAEMFFEEIASNNKEESQSNIHSKIPSSKSSDPEFDHIISQKPKFILRKGFRPPVIDSKTPLNYSETRSAVPKFIASTSSIPPSDGMSFSGKRRSVAVLGKTPINKQTKTQKVEQSSLTIDQRAFLELQKIIEKGRKSTLPKKTLKWDLLDTNTLLQHSYECFCDGPQENVICSLCKSWKKVGVKDIISVVHSIPKFNSVKEDRITTIKC